MSYVAVNKAPEIVISLMTRHTNNQGRLRWEALQHFIRGGRCRHEERRTCVGKFFPLPQLVIHMVPKFQHNWRGLAAGAL